MKILMGKYFSSLMHQFFSLKYRKRNLFPTHTLKFLNFQSDRILLNLGCGSRYHPSWINIDYHGDGLKVFPWDLRKGIPLPNRTCDAVYVSHVLEHFERDAARTFLLECFRVLKPMAILRLVVPDLEGIVRSYLKCFEEALQNNEGSSARYEWSVIELLDQLVRHKSGGEMAKYWAQVDVPAEDYVVQRVGMEYHCARKSLRGKLLPNDSIVNEFSVGRFRLGGEPHQWMYDRYSLKQLMISIGFESVCNRSPTESFIENFSDFNLDTEADGTVCKPDSLFMEGRKPY